MTKFRYLGLNTDTCSDNIDDYIAKMMIARSDNGITA